MQKRIFVLLCALALSHGCATDSKPVVVGGSSVAAPASFGPKKTVAVSKFDANGAFIASYGGYDVVGGGLAAMLITSLEESGRFIVVDRSDLSSVLREQEMGMRGLTTANTAPEAGAMLGAQAIIRGSVTDYQARTKGGGFSVGGIIPNVPLAGALSPRSNKGTLSADFKLVDTTTSRVIKAVAVEKEVGSNSLALSVASSNVSATADTFERTPLGKAMRSVIDEAVQAFVAAMDPIPWQAMVAQVKGGSVYVNAGATANVKVGDQLEVFRVTDRVIDPVTQEILGVEERRIGAIQISAVNPRFSTATVSSGSSPRTGDVLRYSGSATP